MIRLARRSFGKKMRVHHDANSLQFSDYAYDQGKCVRVMNSLSNRDGVEKRTLLVTAAEDVNEMISAKTVARVLRLKLQDDPSAAVIDCGYTAPSNGERLVYCVLDSEKAAYKLSQLYRLDIPVSNEYSVRCSVQLMSASLFNLRVSLVPPTSTIDDLFNFAVNFGVPKLIEQEADEDGILTDTYIIVVETATKQGAHQRAANSGQMNCRGVTYNVQYQCFERKDCLKCSGCFTAPYKAVQQQRNSVTSGGHCIISSGDVDFGADAASPQIPYQIDTVEDYIDSL